MPEYVQSELNTDVAALVSGSFSATKFLIVANMAVQEVVGSVDMKSLKRRTALSPNLFDDIFAYTAPTGLKGMSIIDIQPQINRGRHDSWRLTTAEEFDRRKKELRTDKFGDPITLNKNTHWRGENLVAISDRDFTKKLLLSRLVDDDEVVIDRLSALGDWEAFGDGTNVTRDADNYVKGSASLNWDINADGGTTAGVQNTALTQFDISDYISTGSVFVWAYISSATDLTNFILRVGNSSSAYYYITITTTNEGASFAAGWNLLRFDFADKATTGTITADECDYVVLYMTKDAGKTSETDYRFDNLVMKKGKHQYVWFYSKYGWQTSAGVLIENATTTTDVLNMDIEEYNLIKYKTAELMERWLKKHAEADRYLKIYEEKKFEYEMNYPSEALLLMQTYYDL